MNAIAAVSLNWGIGRGNSLLFHIKEDMQRFRSLTGGGTVIMGRKTLDSMPGGKPLPKRRNIVITRSPDFSREGVEVAHSLEEEAQAYAVPVGADVNAILVARRLVSDALQVAMVVQRTLSGVDGIILVGCQDYIIILILTDVSCHAQRSLERQIFTVQFFFSQVILRITCFRNLAYLFVRFFDGYFIPIVIIIDWI